MSMLPPAGWYPDPADAVRERWWDGKAWSDHVRASANPSPVPVAPPAVPAPHAPVTAPWVQPDPVEREPAVASWAGQPSDIGMMRRFHGFRYRNAVSFSAITFALIYTAIGYFEHFYILGIFPILTAVGAVRRREKLAPLAVLISLLPLVLLIVHRR